MGWNSYDSYCGDVTEEEVKRNADHMARRLARLGWRYIVMDFYWYYPHPVSPTATTKVTWKWQWTITGGRFRQRTGFLRRWAAADSNLSLITSTARA